MAPLIGSTVSIWYSQSVFHFVSSMDAYPLLTSYLSLPYQAPGDHNQRAPTSTHRLPTTQGLPYGYGRGWVSAPLIACTWCRIVICALCSTIFKNSAVPMPNANVSSPSVLKAVYTQHRAVSVSVNNRDQQSFLVYAVRESSVPCMGGTGLFL